MPKSLYHPAEIATCRPNGFGLCQTHVTCGHVKESLHEANMQIERLRQESRRDNANIERKQEEIASLRNACRMNEDTIASLRKEKEHLEDAHENMRNDLNTMRKLHHEQSKTIVVYQESCDKHVEVRNEQGDRIDRWRNEIREALRLYRLECKVSAEIKLEMLLGEE